MKLNANVIRAVLFLSIGLLVGAAHGQASLKSGNVSGDPGNAVAGANNQSQPLGEVVATETLVRHTVKATETAPGLIQSVQLLPDGQIQISLNAPEGERYAVHTSTNLLDWVTLTTFVATGDLMEVLVADVATDLYRFYRLELLSSEETFTTVSGRVLDTNDLAVEGATVTVTVGTFGKKGTTDSDGRYVIKEVPTDLGNLLVSAFLAKSNIPLTVGSAMLTPVPGGVSGLEPLVLEPGVSGMAYIPPGSFVMGSPESEAERHSDETPHQVTLTQGIWMGRYEVTQREYLDVMGSNPSHFRNGVSSSGASGGEVMNELEHPVEQVRWADATNYCARLTEREVKAGRIPSVYRFRLPTESEWEYACRAGTTTAFHSGKALRGGMANFYVFSEYDSDVGDIQLGTWINYLGRTSPVGSYEPNGFGLYDMHGNVSEWCQDWYGAYRGTEKDPQGPVTGSLRIFRGGGWSSFGRNSRSAVRFRSAPGSQGSTIGFRVILVAKPFTTVSGRVLDTNGQSVVGVTVTVGTVGTVEKSGTTDSEGRYFISEVPVDLGNLVVKAVLDTTNIPLRAASEFLSPVPFEVIEVAPLVLVPEFAGMAYIPPGTFVMGSPGSESLRGADEMQHQVTLTQGIWMGRYEVTQREYLDVMGSNPSYFRNGRTPFSPGLGGVVTNELEHPVEQVSWFNATNYCARLTEREVKMGRIPAWYRYRLPTEAEWEYACRGGMTTAFQYGKAILGGMANFYALSEYDADVGDILVGMSTNYLGRTSPVGSYEPNRFGLYDMHGNVWEWCQDWYGTYPGTVVDPQGPVLGSIRVLRGGSWVNDGRFCRSSFRIFNNPSNRYYGYVGFRVVLAPGQP